MVVQVELSQFGVACLCLIAGAINLVIGSRKDVLFVHILRILSIHVFVSHVRVNSNSCNNH